MAARRPNEEDRFRVPIGGEGWPRARLVTGELTALRQFLDGMVHLAHEEIPVLLEVGMELQPVDGFPGVHEQMLLGDSGTILEDVDLAVTLGHGDEVGAGNRRHLQRLFEADLREHDLRGVGIGRIRSAVDPRGGPRFPVLDADGSRIRQRRPEDDPRQDRGQDCSQQNFFAHTELSLSVALARISHQGAR